MQLDIAEFIDKWWGTPGGQEKSNFPPFITDLCQLLDVDPPGQSEKGKLGAYEYEGSVPGGSLRSLDGTGSIDLYKRAHFIMEAKQSYLKPEQTPLDLGEPPPTKAPSGARYDKLMRDARLQAENYAKNLPGAEPVAPFLIVCDIGRAFELYVDTAGNGRGYKFFPDKQHYRIELPDLASDRQIKGTECTPLELLRSIWTDPRSVDPRFQSAYVTRTVAANLASVSQYLESGIKAKGLSPRDKAEEIEEASLFLMRILFCMFAEDIGLLPKDRFKDFLKRAEANDQLFRNGLADLFQKMNSADESNRFAHALETDVRYFNGKLFENNRTYPLGGYVIHDLYEAARQNWRRVEPAIFGTLLEQALDEAERAKLGAHYTPRPYVQTLVEATIMDVLEPEWEAIEEQIGEIVEQVEAAEDGDRSAALELARDFHDRLAVIRVLDPACGTGNFLYVAMELMQGLEARVIERIQTLGGEADPKVGPHQFHGLELNPRAAKIAELVLWIGWLRNRLEDDPESVPEPVLEESASINFGRHGGYDAVLKQTELGQPDLENPAIPDWPEAEFIVGNPPFIGKGAEMRDNLGDDYVEALWEANSRVAGSADFVMQWWDQAAHSLVANDSPLRRFGFVTTNSISQAFNRRVIKRYLLDENATLSIVMAVPDHPWYKKIKEDGPRTRRRTGNRKETEPAAVRIAMTVAEKGMHEGELIEVIREAKLDTDEPEIDFVRTKSKINADLSIGADVTSTVKLKANQNLSCNGMMLAGQGFKLDRRATKELTKQEARDVSDIVRGYMGGSELLHGRKGYSVIDFFGLSESEARKSYPILYDHVLKNVWEYEEWNEKEQRYEKKGRKYNNRPALKKRWWIFAEPRSTFRPSLANINRYIATTETSKHRIFQFVSTDILPDHMVVAIGSDDAFHLGVLQSTIHVKWALRSGGTLEDRPRYNKSKIFEPFPFPNATDGQRAAIADLAEELDATRKAAVAETDKLTMTELYNLREKLRSGDPLSDKEERRATRARAAIINRLHEQIDQAVADAYGWGKEWQTGELGPSEIVARLVALNHERAAEEEKGIIRWLRPDYQEPRFGKKKA